LFPARRGTYNRITKERVMEKKKEDLLKEIIGIEWQMFENVPNVGGKALCQEDPATFEVMRLSQGLSWSEAALESYLDDLKEAEKEERNLLTEKYARMMKSTVPSEYAQIEHLLPPLDPEVFPLIDKIAEIVLQWQEELVERFPHVLAGGRPIRASQDTPFATSFETYLRGELLTYSRRTLELYHQNLLQQRSEKINGAEITLEFTVKQYGYASLVEANEKLKNR